MCLAPQRRALLKHLNVQKWSESAVFLVFSGCHGALRHSGVHFFYHPNFQKWSENVVFLIWTRKCVSRRNGAQQFISSPATWLRTRRLRETISRPFGVPRHWKKKQCSATFLPFRTPASSFFWPFLLSDLLSSVFSPPPTSVFQLPMLWEVDF